jgi:hypothetical protein
MWCFGIRVDVLVYLDEVVELVVFHDEVLAALAEHFAVGLGALGLASGAAVLEPHLHLSGLHPQLHCQSALLVRVGPLQPLERLLQVPQLGLGKPQLLACP